MTFSADSAISSSSTTTRIKQATGLRTVLLVLLLMPLFSISSRAIELKLSPQSLERTLRAQLFNGPEGRYYLRGDLHSACYVYADQPSVHFAGDRIVVHVHTRSRLGTGVFGKCVGLGFSTDADVSVLPDAEGETIGFRDARIEKLTGSREIDFLLIPFLSRKLPQELTVNAAEIIRQLLNRSRENTGYAMSLEKLKIHSMIVENGILAVDLDGALHVD